MGETEEIKLEPKLVGTIEGNFFVPSYQRGYRWGKDEVWRLLEDVYANGGKSYCLQPVVVRKKNDKYELIDGQQRLTTIYLIYKFMRDKGGAFMPEPKFMLTYDTREKSAEFLKNMDLSLRDDNIDFWFMTQAYETIGDWFAKQNNISSFLEISSYFEKYVKIIWYEVNIEREEDAIALFTRLNIGKIPLTSAELIKAMILSSSNKNMTLKKQQEIALHWDNIEKELHNDSLWYFFTNETKKDSYQTRIDLVLDLIAKKTIESKDDNATFIYFDNLRKQDKNLDDIWDEIQHTFLILKDWYEDHTLYHKIGYLIAAEALTLQEVFYIAEGKTKKQFVLALNEQIKKSIECKVNYAELSYEKPDEYKKISMLLLLFNVESVRLIDGEAQRFPFDKFKAQNGNISWSLEHIHAQQSEGMQTQELWKKWLLMHIPSIKALEDDNEVLIKKMQEAYEKSKLDRIDFESLQEQVIYKLSAQGSVEYLHSISNLALLNTSDNAALSNAMFDVKRNVIIEMDKKGQYIPFCTKMVFLKYYTESKDNQVHFWGAADRIAYVKGINRVLAPYLQENITVEKEERNE